MDEEQLAKLKALLGPQVEKQGPTQGDVQLNNIRRGMLTPEQLAYEDFQLANQTTPVMHRGVEPPPEIQRQLEEDATKNYNSPEARAIRMKYDPDERLKHSNGYDFEKQQKFQQLQQILNKK